MTAPPLTSFTHDALLASHWLKQGNLLAYPTESVWGIGCDAYNEKAVRHILNIKNRPIDKGMIVITDSINRISDFLNPLQNRNRQQILDSWQVSATQNKLSKSHQASTWLLPIPKSLVHPIPMWITGKHDSVAVRVINHPLIKTLCANMVSDTNLYGFIISTSCNVAGQLPANNLEEAFAYFGDNELVKYLQGETLGYTMPSQIRDAITGEILR